MSQAASIHDTPASTPTPRLRVVPSDPTLAVAIASGPSSLARYVGPLADGHCPPGLQAALQRMSLDARKRGLGPVAGLAAALEDAVAALLARPGTPDLQRQVAQGVALAERMRQALRDGEPLGPLVIAAADHIAALEACGLASLRPASGPAEPRWAAPWTRRTSATRR